MSTHPTVKVWLIEDNAPYRVSVARAIDRTPGFTCSCHYSSFEEAREALSGPEHPDVLLLDVGLPGLDGISALAEIRRLCPATKVVILTVFDDADKIFAAICAGASGYLLKTASIKEVADAIQQAIDGGAPMTPKVARRVIDRFSMLEGQSRSSPDYNLTEREKEVLELLAQGLIKKQISEQLDISVHTVTTHIRRVYEKLHVTTNTAAVAKALRERLI